MRGTDRKKPRRSFPRLGNYTQL